MRFLYAMPFLILNWSSASAFAECPNPMYQPWLAAQEAISQDHPELDVAARVQMRSEEWAIRQELVQAMIGEYFHGQRSATDFAVCVGRSPFKQNLLYTFQARLYERSVQTFMLAHSPILKNLAKTANASGVGNSFAVFRKWPLFRASDHYAQIAPTNAEGGYNREHGTLFMNLDKVPPGEWYIIFAHELIHGLDEKLETGTREYQFESGKDPTKLEPRDFKKLYAIADKTDNPRALSPSDRETMAGWLRAGLNRGLWAEYRAWYLTFRIYGEGLKEGLWSKVDWIEAILQQKPTAQRLEVFVYHYLDDRAANPKRGIFAKPLVAKFIQELREEARNASPPPLGGLEKILPVAP